MNNEFDPITGLARGSFGIGTFRSPEGTAFPALVHPDGTVRDLSTRWIDTHAIFDSWERSFEELSEIADDGHAAEFRLDELVALPPLAHPNILGAGANYRQHVAEMMTHNKATQHLREEGQSDESFFERNLAEIERRANEGIPFFWTGMHSSLAGANDDVPLPPVGEHPDWELEFGVVLAKGGRLVAPEDADDLIAGYIMVNDLGAVDEFRRTDVYWGYDWVSKHQPNFKPAGPFIVPKQFVDRSKVRIRLSVNGKVMQDWPISDMIFPPEKILSYASERVRLMPGDLLITGSPPGNAGSHGGAWLKPGDLIESEVTYLGRQRNQVVAEDTQGRKLTFGSFPTD